MRWNWVSGVCSLCVQAKSLSRVWLFVTAWTVAPLASCVHKILQARVLEWVAIPFSKRSSQPRDWTCISYVSCMDRWVLYYWCHLGSIFGPTVYKRLGLPSVWKNRKYLFLVWSSLRNPSKVPRIIQRSPLPDAFDKQSRGSQNSLNLSGKECPDWIKHRLPFFPFPNPLGADRSGLRTEMAQICSDLLRNSRGLCNVESSQLLWNRLTRSRTGETLPFKSVHQV